MRNVAEGLLSAVLCATLMLLLSPRAGYSQFSCGGTSWCASERQGCFDLCGRCGVDWFSCTFGSTCGSDCQCHVC